MDKRLLTLIRDYQVAVREAIDLLEVSGISRPASCDAWAQSDMPQCGTLDGGIKYYKHGYGVAVHLRTGLVDMDFGKRGEIDGFDLSRLQSFASARCADYGFKRSKELAASFEDAARHGDLRYSGYILYYLHADRLAAPPPG